jgi:hypothetical protein
VIVVIAAIMILGVAAWIAAPLLKTSSTSPVETDAQRADALSTEKHMALVAIKEADFDRAMGKLSDEDYGALRQLYEDRALGVMAELDALAPHESSAAHEARNGVALASYCVGCGARFGTHHRFCAVCGVPRASSPM